MKGISFLRTPSVAHRRRECVVRFLALTTLLQSASVLAALPLPIYDPAKVSNPSATVSAGATAMGAIPAEFSVSPDGSANYSMPLQVVPGRAGFQPNLSIDYSSSSGNGQLGVGFDLSGVGSIHRCAKTIHEDGKVRGVKLDKEDRFCLGGRKLVAVTGTYGANGTEYRTVPDTHVRVRSFIQDDYSGGLEGPSYFIVELPDGQSQYYGVYANGDKDTSIVNAGIYDFNVGWPLSYVRNGSGDVIKYSYGTRLAARGNEVERWLTEISYGGQGVERQVRFNYETRPDPSYGWRYGAPREATKRLQSIEQFQHVSGALKRVRKYSLEYIAGSTASLGTGRSKLKRVTECGSFDSECLRPTELSWQWGGSGFQGGVAQGMALPTSADTTIIAADLDGDGRTDFAYPNTSTCKWRFAYAKPTAADFGGHYPEAKDAAGMDCDPLTRALAFDYDLNGTTDLLPLERTFGGSAMYKPILMQRDRTWIKAFTAFNGAMVVDPVIMPSASFVFGDFNGDGLQDVLEREHRGLINVPDWTLRMRTGEMGNIAGGNAIENLAWVADGFRSNQEGLEFHTKVHVLDIDGDGMDEILNYSEMSIADLDGNVMQYKRAWDPFLARFAEVGVLPRSPFYGTLKWLDLNADGLTDMVTNVYPGAVAPGTSLYYYLNNGRGFTTAIPMQGITLPKDAFEAAQVIDVNRDGRDELLVPRGYTGASFEPLFSGLDLIQGSFNTQGVLSFARSVNPVVVFSTALTRNDLQTRGLRIVDADGDGQLDLMVLNRPSGASSGNSAVLHKSAHSMGDRLIEIRDGRQISDAANTVPSVKITYAPLSDPSVYSLGDCTRVEFMTCASGSSMFVVKKAELDAGLNAKGDPATLKARVVSEYFYTKGRFDRVTRRFTGFREVLKTTYGEKGSLEIAITRTRSFYNNAIVGRPPMLNEEWVFTRLPGDRESLTQSKFSWGEKLAAGSGTYFRYLSKKTVSSFEFPRLFCQYTDCLAYDSQQNLQIYNKVAHRTEETAHPEVDTYGNIGLKVVTTKGPGYAHTSETRTWPNIYIDGAHWLLRRPLKIVTSNHGNDGIHTTTEKRTAEYTYHEGTRHLLKQEKRYGATTADGPVLIKAYEYYLTGGLISRITTTDANTGKQRERTFAYDPYGFHHAEKNGLGHTSYTGYDPVLGVAKVMVDANQLRTDLTYDSLGRLRKTAAPGGRETSYSYTLHQVGDESLVTRVTSESGGAHAYTTFDRSGRPLLEGFTGFDSWTRQKQYEYDARGRLISSDTYKRTFGGAPTYATQYEYDNLGRMLKRIEPGNVVRRWEYDKLTMTEINSRGYKKSLTLDQRSRKVLSVDGVGTNSEVRRSYGYTPFDAPRRTQVLGISASENVLGYDALGRLISSHDSERGHMTYERTAFGDVASIFHGDGVSIDRYTVHEIDTLGRIVRSLASDGAGTRSVSNRTYDKVDGRTLLGGLLRAEFTDHVAGGSKHTTEYFFDVLGRLSRTDYTLPSSTATPATEETLSVVHSYDQLSRLASLTYPLLVGQSEATKVVYDYVNPLAGNGMVERVRAIESLQGVPAKSTVLWTAEATDEQDRLSKFMAGGVHTEKLFDWRGLTLSTQIRNDGNDDANSDGLLAMMQFGYDGEGNLIRRTDDLQPAAEYFAYDELDRLRASSTKTVNPLTNPDDVFFYDRLGNLTGSTRRGINTFDVQRPTQLLTSFGGMVSGQRVYTYDYFGNQVGRPEGSVVYNDFNLPSRMTDSGGTTTASFLYDAAGMRVRKTSTTGIVTYIPGMYERHQPLSSANQEHRFIVQGTGATLRYQHEGRRLSKLPTLYSHGDALSSTSLVTQNDMEPTGGLLTVVKEKRSYESFGLPRNPDWTSTDVFGGIQPALLAQGYTGHDEDRELGTVNMKGRIYDPKLGRFLTPDPFVDGMNPTQRWNRYAYVSNNPLSATDPSGFRMNQNLEERVAARMRQFAGVGQTIDGGATTFSAEPVVVDQGSLNPGKEMMDSADRTADWTKRTGRCEAHGCSAEEWEQIREEFLERWDDPVESKENVSGKDAVKELVPDVTGVSGKEAGKMDGALAFNEKEGNAKTSTAGCSGMGTAAAMCSDFLNSGAPLYTPQEWEIRTFHEMLQDMADGVRSDWDVVTYDDVATSLYNNFTIGPTADAMTPAQAARFHGHGDQAKDAKRSDEILNTLSNAYNTRTSNVVPMPPRAFAPMSAPLR